VKIAAAWTETAWILAHGPKGPPRLARLPVKLQLKDLLPLLSPWHSGQPRPDWPGPALPMSPST